MSTQRMDPDELAKRAADLAPVAPANGLDPMAMADVLDHLGEELRLRMADLWTLRDSIDAELSGTDHADAVADLATLADRYAATLDAAREFAAARDHRLPIDQTGPPW